MSKYCDNKMIWSQTKRISKAATCMAVCPTYSDWDKVYFAVALHSGDIQAYNIAHKISFSTARLNSNVLSLASSLKVHIYNTTL